MTETPFTGEEIETGGNMGFDEGFELVSDALVEFMGANPQPFETDAVALSYMTKDELAEMHERLGDSATVVVLATDTAASVQSAGGEDPTEEGPLLQQACWTGAFLGWVSDGKSETMSVSPGDVQRGSVPGTRELFEQQLNCGDGAGDGDHGCEHPISCGVVRGDHEPFKFREALPCFGFEFGDVGADVGDFGADVADFGADVVAQFGHVGA